MDHRDSVSQGTSEKQVLSLGSWRTCVPRELVRNRLFLMALVSLGSHGTIEEPAAIPALGELGFQGNQ